MERGHAHTRDSRSLSLLRTTHVSTSSHQVCRDLTGVTQSQADTAPLWNKVVENFFQFLVQHDLVEDTSSSAAGRSKSHLHNFRLRRGVAWINHGPADLRDFVIKQCWISGRPRDKDHGAPPIFLRGPLVDIRKGIASLFKWEQELKAEQGRSAGSRSTPFLNLEAKMAFKSSLLLPTLARPQSKKILGQVDFRPTNRLWRVC